MRSACSGSALTVCAVLAALGCEPKPDPGGRRGPAMAATPSASAPPVVDESAPAPVVASQIEVPGLRVRSGSIPRQTLWGFSELTVDLKRVRLDVVERARGAPLNQLLPAGALAVVNGGYFEADFRPSTWVVKGGVELASKSDTSKGGLLALRGERSFVGAFTALVFEPELAVQSFPLIVEDPQRPGIHRDDGRRAARTVVCQVAEGLRFVIIAAPRGDGPTLFESMSLLLAPPPGGFGCRVALNLDGGPSSGVWFGPEVGAKQRLPTAPVAYGIAILPRL